MKLYVKRLSDGGRPVFALVSEDGEALPGQVSFEYRDHVRHPTEVKVTFVLDGERIGWWSENG